VDSGLVFFIIAAICPVLDINFIRLFVRFCTGDPKQFRLVREDSVDAKVDAVMESVFTSCFPVHGKGRYQIYR